MDKRDAKLREHLRRIAKNGPRRSVKEISYVMAYVGSLWEIVDFFSPPMKRKGAPTASRQKDGR